MGRIEPIKTTNIINEIKAIEQKNLKCETNKTEFKQIVNHQAVLQMSPKEYKTLLKSRPLIKYRPLKNSLAKRIDKSLLAEGLNIPEDDIEDYISGIVKNNFEEDSIVKLNKNLNKTIKQSEINMIRNYVYRHGKKNEVIAYLDNELSIAKDILKTLYKTLDDELSGVSSYYSRPCHPLSDNDAEKMHNVIQKNLNNAEMSGQISKADKLEAADYALNKIKLIQDNPDLRQAFRFVWNHNV